MKIKFLGMLMLACFPLHMLFATTATATATIKGKVVDEKNNPVVYATATLISPETGEIIKGEVCNDKGEFSIQRVNRGEYILQVSMLGFEKFETEKMEVDGRRDVIETTVTLHESTELLNDVVVVGKKNFIEQTVDKLVIHPDASITSASDNVFEILKKLPGVTIDNNDNISLKGMQGVKVLIDDKPTYVSSTQLAALLKSIEGKNVEKIELIENPSARYDAEGNSGIINIKTKHNRAPGFNGNVSAGLNLGERLGGNAGLNLNMNMGKLNLYGDYSNYHWAGVNGMYATRRFTSTALEGAMQKIDNLGSYWGSSHNYKVGADYYLAKNHVISAMFRGNHGNNKNKENSTTSFTDRFEQVDSSLVTISNSGNKWNSATYNLNYKWDIDTIGQSLSVDADFATFGFMSTNVQEGKYYDVNQADMNQDLFVMTSQGNDIRIFTSKADYVLPIGKKYNFEAGLKASFVNTDSYIDMDGYLVQEDQFIYTENILAAYVNARAQWNKTTVQLGLRMEDTFSKGNSVTNNEVNDTSYLKIFPSFFVQHQLNDNHSLNLKYSYRIGRPSYHNLNPFRWMVDPFTYNVGNPNLKPQFTHSGGLSHNFKNVLITNLGVNYTTGLFTEIIRQDDASKTVYQTMENLNSSLDLNLSETVQVRPFEWWRLSATVTGMYKNIEMYDESTEPLSRFSVIANMSNNISLPWKIDMELSGRYSSEQLISNIVILPRYSIDLGFQKRILKDKGMIKLSVSDIFKTANGQGAYAKYDNVDITVQNIWDSRRLNLTFNYRFGKDDFKTRANRSTSSSEEQNRSSK